MGNTTRYQALAEVNAGFMAQRSPRLIVSLILALAALAAFGVSAGTLRLGVEEMWLRYLGATIAGYVTFLMLIRLWITFHREDWYAAPLPDFGGTPVDESATTTSAGFSGGASGGGGASSSWGRARAPQMLDKGIGVDFDDAWPLVLAVVLALGAAIAMLYVVYAAPALLAEIALDAALVTGIYRKVRKQDLRHWLYSAVRNTWIPAIVVAVFMALGGALLQWAEPEARSLGDVVRAVSAR